MVWYVGRHEKDSDAKYAEAVEQANNLLKVIGFGVGLGLAGIGLWLLTL